MVALIAQRPDPGEPSPQALGVAFSQAIQSDDVAAVNRLVLDPPEGERLREFLSRAQCGTSVRVNGRRLEILNGISVCGRIPIQEENGRWFIDPWADPLGYAV